MSTFGFASTAAEVAAGVDLTGRRAVVTGAASGIGVETARALAGRGAEVTLAVRDTAAGERVAADIGAAVRVARLDLADPASVIAFADGWSGPLHILVNNAGIMALPERTLTPAGAELQFATNHLGHFLLATRLHGALAAEGARVVSLSSTAHTRCPVLFDDLTFAFVAYDGWLAYGQAKTANVLFAVEGTRRWAGDGITVNAVMPGGIATNLQRHVGGQAYMDAAAERLGADRIKTVQQGAATSVWVATAPELEGVGGRYYEDCAEAAVIASRDEGNGLSGVAPYALDRANAERLWTVSEALTAGF